MVGNTENTFGGNFLSNIIIMCNSGFYIVSTKFRSGDDLGENANQRAFLANFPPVHHLNFLTGHSQKQETQKYLSDDVFPTALINFCLPLPLDFRL